VQSHVTFSGEVFIMEKYGAAVGIGAPCIPWHFPVFPNCFIFDFS